MLETATGPLAGVRVIEFGQLLAGPFAGTILAYFGAEVIKIEPPTTGDPIRGWRKLDENGTSFWWRSLGRNKKSVTLDLKTKDGQKIARKLTDTADVLIENFRPGTMEKWGLGPDELKQTNPSLVYARISGYGQDGPYSNRPGFASVCEGMSGFRYLNGYPNEVPVRTNLSIGDTIAGLHTVLGIMMALFAKQKGSAKGQVVDVALYESMYNLMEAVVPEYSGAGVIREPAGTTVTGIVPTNTYTCADGKFVVIGGNGDSIFKRLMEAVERPDLAADARLENNEGRVKHETEIDNVLAEWCASLPASKALEILAKYKVPSGSIYSVKDMFEDPHYQARGMFENVEIDGKPLQIPALTPKLSETPGTTKWPGAEVGEHTDSVLSGVLDLSAEEISVLRENNVI